MSVGELLMTAHQTATDGNGMHASVGCNSVFHCSKMFISKRQRKGACFLNVFTFFQRGGI
jgi:hypothetical protein